MDARVNDARIGQGDVPLTLGEDEVVLQPSYNAARTISSMSGGLAGAIDRVLKLDIETVTTVISVGLGYSQSNKAPKDLGERIWRTGLSDDSGGLVERCVLYLRVLAAGGRMPKDGNTEADEDRPNPR